MTVNKPYLKTELQQYVKQAVDGVIITRVQSKPDKGPDIIEINPSLEAMTGYRRNELIGQNLGTILSDGRSPLALTDINRLLAARARHRCRALISRKTRPSLWAELSIIPMLNQPGRSPDFALIFRDLTSFTKLEELLSGGLLDPPTGPGNPKDFSIALTAEWQRAKRHHSTFTVLYSKLIPSASQSRLDYSQISAAEKLYQNQFRKEDSVGKLGNFEFAVLLPEIDLSLAGKAVIRLENSLKNSRELSGFSLLTGLAERHLLDTNSEAVLARAQEGLGA